MKNIKIHFGIWIIYFFIAYISDFILEPSTTILVEIMIFLSHNVFLFYSILFVIKKFSANTKFDLSLSVLRCLILVALFFTIKYFIIYFIFPKIYGLYADPSKIKWITVGILWMINYFLFASAYFYFVTSIEKQKDLKRMLEERLIQEKEKLELENTLLKVQINPHFLFNALSFLYAKSLPLSTELAEGIMRMSDIMRYSFKSNDEDGQVKLSDEVAHIQNIIGMAQQRFSNRIFLEFSVNGNIDGVTIIPFVLITLVENMLKHGTINQQECPARIRLDIIKARELQFTTWNKMRIGPKEQTTSIGLNNTIKRLEYAYGKNCKFEIKEESDDFSVHLSILLKPILPAAA